MSVAKTCLVTGGAGFIGSHLTDRLLAGGHRVVVLDDFTTGRRENLAHLAGHPRFELREHDVTLPYDVEADWLFNLACPASPPKYQADPVRTTLVSVLGTLHALRLAARRGMRVLQASTSEVYGDPDVHPQPETYVGAVNPIGPRACYDEGKRCAETLCFDFHRGSGVDIRVIRIFNTYGPRMDPDDGRVVSNFIAQALRGEALTIYGDGTQTRSLCYVDDLIDGIVAMMAQDRETGPVNLGNPVELTMNELAHLVAEIVPGSAGVVACPLPTDDPKQRRPDIRRAEALFGFAPKTAVREGLLATAADFRARGVGSDPR